MKNLWLFLIVGIVVNLNAEESLNNKYQKVNLIAELGGNGFIYSVGLDFANFKNNKLDDSFRLGASYLPDMKDNNNLFTAFVEFNKDLGRKNNYLELGISPVCLYDQGPYFTLDGRIGYRFNSESFIFRIAFIPIFKMPVNTEFKFIPFAGLSIGFPL